jgi:hypothetical protein
MSSFYRKVGRMKETPSQTMTMIEPRKKCQYPLGLARDVTLPLVFQRIDLLRPNRQKMIIGTIHRIGMSLSRCELHRMAILISVTRSFPRLHPSILYLLVLLQEAAVPKDRLAKNIVGEDDRDRQSQNSPPMLLMVIGVVVARKKREKLLKSSIMLKNRCRRRVLLTRVKSTENQAHFDPNHFNDEMKVPIENE